jgi:thioredoxin-dependent peroxiredoxin
MFSRSYLAGGFCSSIATSFLALVACMGSASAAGPSTRPASAAAPPKVGEAAPEFSLLTLSDKEVGLKELSKQGPVVLIVLRGWVGYQCPVCTKQVGDFAAKAKEFEEKGARVMLIYPGPSRGLKAHAEDFESGKGIPENFIFVTDPDFTFTNLYGLRWNAKGETAYPAAFVIDKTGVVRFAKVSRSHGGRASAAEVLKALEELK